MEKIEVVGYMNSHVIKTIGIIFIYTMMIRR